MSEALRIGVIGLGMMGRNHVRVAGEVDGVELVGVADPMGDRFGVAGAAPVSPRRKSSSATASTWRSLPPPRATTSVLA